MCRIASLWRRSVAYATQSKHEPRAGSWRGAGERVRLARCCVRATPPHDSARSLPRRAAPMGVAERDVCVGAAAPRRAPTGWRLGAAYGAPQGAPPPALEAAPAVLHAAPARNLTALLTYLTYLTRPDLTLACLVLDPGAAAGATGRRGAALRAQEERRRDRLTAHGDVRGPGGSRISRKYMF